jgi:hypothetical protein
MHDREAVQYAQGWVESMYQKQIAWHAMLSVGLVVASAVLLALLITKRSRKARILLGLLSLVIPVLAAVLCVHPDSVLPRYLDTTGAAVFIGAGVLSLIGSLCGAFMLLGSRSIRAYTARQDSPIRRPVLRVAA